MIIRTFDQQLKKEMIKFLFSLIKKNHDLFSMLQPLLNQISIQNINNKDVLNRLNSIIEEESDIEKLNLLLQSEEHKEFLLEMAFFIMSFDTEIYEKNLLSYFSDLDINIDLFRRKFSEVNLEIEKNNNPKDSQIKIIKRDADVVKKDILLLLQKISERFFKIDQGTSKKMFKIDKKAKDYKYINIKTFLDGYCNYLETRNTTKEAYSSMRKLYILTNGRFNDLITFIFSYIKPIEIDENTKKSLFGNFSCQDIDKIIDNIYNEGFHIMDNTLPEEIINELVTLAQTAQAITNSDNNSSNNILTSYNKDNPIAEKYSFDENILVKNISIQKLLLDPLINNIADKYFFSKAKMNSILMWWSSPYLKGKASNNAAQMFHFDMDRIRFLNFFIYLTDVDNNNGPHCYVKHSNKRKPIHLLREGRITDTEIENFYSNKEIINITGKKGTFFIADTRGFHKGNIPINNDRLVLQFTFATDLFGQNYNRKIKSNLLPEPVKNYLSENKYELV